jgi:cell division protein FtsL
MMLKLVNGVLVIMALVAGSLLYALEHKTRGLEREIAATKRAIADTDEDIKLLGAEWSSLTRPERIQKLAAQNLQLGPAQAEQYVSLNELQARMEDIRTRAKPEKEQDVIGDLLQQMQ